MRKTEHRLHWTTHTSMSFSDGGGLHVAAASVRGVGVVRETFISPGGNAERAYAVDGTDPDTGPVFESERELIHHVCGLKPWRGEVARLQKMLRDHGINPETGEKALRLTGGPS